MAAAPAAAPQTPTRLRRRPSPRIAIEDDRAGAALAVLDRAGSAAFPVAVQVEALDAEPDAALDRQLDAFAARRIPIWLTMPAPARIEDVEPWRAPLRRLLDRHGRSLTILEVPIDDQPAALAAFAVRLASTEVRAAYDTIRVALGGRRMDRRRPIGNLHGGRSRRTSTCCVLPAEADRGGRRGCRASIRRRR